MKKTVLIILIGSLLGLALAACSSSGKSAVPTVVNSTSAPIATQVKSMPTPIPLGQVITYQNLQAQMIQAEITAAYETEFGSSREPTVGGKFLWIELQLENIGPSEQSLPVPEHFSVLYGTAEFKPGYGHRKGSPDYLNLKDNLYQGQKVTAWLRFDIPSAAGLTDLQFAFLPESVHVSFSSPSGSAYSWADHPEYFWQCAP